MTFVPSKPQVTWPSLSHDQRGNQCIASVVSLGRCVLAVTRCDTRVSTNTPPPSPSPICMASGCGRKSATGIGACTRDKWVEGGGGGRGTGRGGLSLNAPGGRPSHQPDKRGIHSTASLHHHTPGYSGRVCGGGSIGGAGECSRICTAARRTVSHIRP